MEWYIFGLISALFSAAAAMIEKKALFKERVLTFTFTLAVFNALISIPFLFFVDYSSLSSTALGVLFFKSILGAGAFLCVMYAIKNLELSEALPLLVMTPGFVALVALIFLGETLTLIEVTGMLLLLSGAYILNLKDGEGAWHPFKVLVKSKGYNAVLLALALFTITSVLDKVILGQYKLPPSAFMGFQHLFLAAIFFCAFLFAGEPPKKLKSTLRTSGWLIFILALVTIGYRYAEILSIKLSSSVALAISIKRISVFFAVVIGGRIFNEKNLLRKAIATIILIAGTLMIIRF